MLAHTKRRSIVTALILAAACALMIGRMGASSIDARISKAEGPPGATRALFGLDAPEHGPFPSDWYTVPDEANITERRVSLPKRDCDVNVSECQDLDVLNGLDGFNVRPRLSVPFTGSIDPGSVTSDTVFLVSLGSTLPGEDYMPRGTKIGIDQVVWDPDTNMLHVESDALLAQHTRFALIVTHGVRDAEGARAKPSDEFEHFRATVQGDYKRSLLDAMQAARAVGVEEDDVAVASVFTTQSVTAVLEKIRDQIHTSTPAQADFLLGPNHERTVFNLAVVTSITWVQAPGTSTNLNLSLVKNTYPGAVGLVAFGKYSSPDYLVHPYQYIPLVATRTGTPAVQGHVGVYFNLFLPSGTKPTGGWPVAIFGHGVSNSKNQTPLNAVATLAHYGIATIAINAVGHGLSPLGTLTVNPTNITFAAGGRGIDQDANGIIGTNEGIGAFGDRQLVVHSDGFRQTAADLMQLVRVIGAGVDVDGDGTADLDPSRLYYMGQSYGAAYGFVFLAVEPDVRVAVLAVPADTIPIAYLGGSRATLGPMLDARQPSILNKPGIKDLGGLVFATPTFDDNMPLRKHEPLEVGFEDPDLDRLIVSPVTNTIPGATAIQEWGEHLEWAGEAGSPAAYAPHLRRAPLAGVPAKSVLLLLAKGDQSAPNPTTTAIVRAAELVDRTLWYQHDVYWKLWTSCIKPEAAGTPAPNPHAFMTALNDTSMQKVSLAAQQTAGGFLASDGGPITVIQPGPFGACSPSSPLFQFPILLPLPESLNYK